MILAWPKMGKEWTRPRQSGSIFNIGDCPHGMVYNIALTRIDEAYHLRVGELDGVQDVRIVGFAQGCHTIMHHKDTASHSDKPTYWRTAK
jgi:hypothetical protein